MIIMMVMMITHRHIHSLTPNMYAHKKHTHTHTHTHTHIHIHTRSYSKLRWAGVRRTILHSWKYMSISWFIFSDFISKSNGSILWPVMIYTKEYVLTPCKFTAVTQRKPACFCKLWCLLILNSEHSAFVHTKPVRFFDMFDIPFTLGKLFRILN